MDDIIVNDEEWQSLKKRLKEEAYVKIGVISASAVDHDGVSMAELAAFHEFGTINVPERSFMRRTLADKAELIRETQVKLARAVVLKKMSLNNAHEALGLVVSTEMKKTITEGAGVPPPLAQSTIDRKGSDRPLVDTGRLVGAISHLVVKGT